MAEFRSHFFKWSDKLQILYSDGPILPVSLFKRGGVRHVFIAMFIATSAICAGNAAQALSLKEAVKIAIKTNPAIGQATENREAVEFELKQALGLYLPRVELEASTGVRRFNDPTRRASGIKNDALYPSDAGIIATFDILDGGFRKSEANRQAARIDSASFRVLERSELTGLEVARLYFEILLQKSIVGMARRNLAFHRKTSSDVRNAIKNGQLTNADRQQASERMAAASASVVQAQDALEIARIGFLKNVGIRFTRATLPRRIGHYLPSSQRQALSTAIRNNSRIRIADADRTAAGALVDQAKGALGPKLSLEGRAFVGHDTSSNDGYSEDLQVKLVMRWRLFDGNVRNSRVQESIRREGSTAFAQLQASRDVKEAVRISWNRIVRQNALANRYYKQLSASNDLVSSYQKQFTVGQRSLLDVLDAQNTRFNVQVLAKTAEYSSRFAEYRLMAATGSLLDYLKLATAVQAQPYAREMLKTPSYKDVPPRKREPVTFTSPIDLTKFVN